MKCGDMQDSLRKDSSNNTAEIGLNAIANGYLYSIVHQFGTLDGQIESRAFIPIKNDGSLYDEVEDALIEIVEEYLYT